MNEQPDDLDVLMRQRFEEFQKDPPEGTWDNILAGLNTPAKPAGLISRRWIFLPIAASVLLVLTGVYLGLSLYRSDVPLTALRLDTLNIQEHRNVPATAAPLKETVSPNIPVTSQIHPVHNIPTPQVIPQNAHDVQQVTEQQLPLPVNSNEDFALAPGLQNQNNTSANLNTGQQIAANTGQSGRNYEVISTMNNKPYNELNITLCSILTPISSPATERLAQRHDYTRHPDFFVGLKYTPAYQMQANNNSFIHGVALDGGIRIRRMIIQTGLGLEFQKAENLVLISYLTDHTGYQKETVKATTHYTYLNLPLIVGYQWNVGKWALSVKGGGIYTLQAGIHRDEISPSDENAVSFQTFDRSTPRKTKWLNAILIPEAEYYLSEHFSVYAEPSFRYTFLNLSSEEKTSSQNLSALGLNAGLKVHF